jgi:hypothetical protein
VTVPRAVLELNEAAIQAALAALREGRSTGDPSLDYVMVALGRCRARSWARCRRAWPDVAEAEIDVAADRAVDMLASVPAVVALLLITDAARSAAAGGAS